MSEPDRTVAEPGGPAPRRRRSPTVSAAARGAHPATVLLDPRTAAVLRRLHAAAARQTPRLIAHYLPKLPRLLTGRPLGFTTEQITTFYADKYLALEPAQAAFCYLQARAIRARRIVEFGTSFGISTLWLAAAVRDNGGGQVITTELVPAKAEQARRNLAEAGLDGFVEIRVGDALQTLRDLPDLTEPVDLLLNDGFPIHALDVLRLVTPVLRPGAVVITDNVGMMPGDYADYLHWVRNPANGFTSTVIPFKSGTELSVRVPADPRPPPDGALLSGVPETALWALRNRAVEAAHPRTPFPDPLAVELFTRLGSPGAQFGRPSQAHALRAGCVDAITRRFLDDHPDGTVVALGEGLQTTFWRLHDQRGRWVSVDLPEIVELRNRLLPTDPRVRTVACSALDRNWMDGIDPEPGVLITAEGLLMYFDPADALGLIGDCAARFPGGQMLFDSIPPWFSRRTLRGMSPTPGYTVPPMPFALTVPQARALPELIPGITSAEDVPMPPGRGVWQVLPTIGRVPLLHGVRPSMTLLRFAANGKR